MGIFILILFNFFHLIVLLIGFVCSSLLCVLLFCFVSYVSMLFFVDFISHFILLFPFHSLQTQQPRAKGGLGKMNIPIIADIQKTLSRDYGVLLTDGEDAGILKH
jgi:hypothetical protein